MTTEIETVFNNGGKWEPTGSGKKIVIEGGMRVLQPFVSSAVPEISVSDGKEITLVRVRNGPAWVSREGTGLSRYEEKQTLAAPGDWVVVCTMFHPSIKDQAFRVTRTR